MHHYLVVAVRHGTVHAHDLDGNVPVVFRLTNSSVRDILSTRKICVGCVLHEQLEACRCGFDADSLPKIQLSRTLVLNARSGNAHVVDCTGHATCTTMPPPLDVLCRLGWSTFDSFERSKTASLQEALWFAGGGEDEEECKHDTDAVSTSVVFVKNRPVFCSKEHTDQLVLDYDVTSFYPTIATSTDIYPPSYKRVFVQLVEMAKRGPDYKRVLKPVCNSWLGCTRRVCPTAYDAMVKTGNATLCAFLQAVMGHYETHNPLLVECVTDGFKVAVDRGAEDIADVFRLRSCVLELRNTFTAFYMPVTHRYIASPSGRVAGLPAGSSAREYALWWWTRMMGDEETGLDVALGQTVYGAVDMGLVRNASAEEMHELLDHVDHPHLSRQVAKIMHMDTLIDTPQCMAEHYGTRNGVHRGDDNSTLSARTTAKDLKTITRRNTCGYIRWCDTR